MGVDGSGGHRREPLNAIDAGPARARASTARASSWRPRSSPWGGAAAYIDAYEAAIRSAAQAQVIAAQAVHLQPARSIVALYADLTRDVGAVQVSAARWILDV